MRTLRNNPVRRTVARHSPGQAGFTLIELMIVLVVVGLVAALATPGMRAIVNNGRLAGLNNDLIGALQVARAEAMRGNTRVIMCGSSDGLTCDNAARWNGWIAFADANADGLAQAAEMLRVEEVREPMQLWVSTNISGTGGRIVFRPDGFAYRNNRTTMLAATLAACVPTDDPVENERLVSIDGGAQVSTARSNNGAVCDAPANP